ncbi:MAG: hypothetical protein U1D30_19290 [Planctomycetota bacterium]
MRTPLLSPVIGLVGLLSVGAPLHAGEEAKSPPQVQVATPQGPGVRKALEHAKIEAALVREITFEFSDTPLADVVGYIRDYTGVNVIVDVAALEEVGINLEIPVTLSMKEVTLKSALRSLLQPLELCTIVRDEALVITTNQRCIDQPSIIVYPVADLVTLRHENGKVSVHGRELANMIESTVAPHTWDYAGSSGTIRFDPLTASLVVGQSELVHEQIKSLLEQLRQAKGELVTMSAKLKLASPESLESSLAASIGESPLRAEKPTRRGSSMGNQGASPAIEAQMAEIKAWLAKLSAKIAENDEKVDHLKTKHVGSHSK